MNSKLLEEAIVDAEALREAALKNAEQAILEKYAPEVKSAIASLLEQDEEPMLDPAMDMAMGADMSAEPAEVENVPLAATEGERLCACPDDGEIVSFSIHQLKDILSDLARANKTGEEEVPMDMTPAAPLEGPALEPAEATPAIPGEEEEELAAPALQEELEISEDLIAAILSESEELEDILEETEEEVLEEEIVEEDNKKDEELQELQSLSESLKKKNSNMLVEQKKSLKENKLLTEKLKRLLEQHNKLLEENKAVKATAVELSKHLEESNLLNAKLFYKNQALGSDSLNERQKNKIVEAVSKAGSVDEVKMIYETLCNAVGTFDSRGPKSLSEAVEKKGGLMLKPRQETNSNPNPLYNKWQKIAGIKK